MFAGNFGSSFSTSSSLSFSPFFNKWNSISLTIENYVHFCRGGGEWEFTFFSNERHGPSEDVHELGKQVRVWCVVELLDIESVVLGKENFSFPKRKEIRVPRILSPLPYCCRHRSSWERRKSL